MGRDGRSAVWTIGESKVERRRRKRVVERKVNGIASKQALGVKCWMLARHALMISGFKPHEWNLFGCRPVTAMTKMA